MYFIGTLLFLIISSIPRYTKFTVYLILQQGQVGPPSNSLVVILFW